MQDKVNRSIGFTDLKRSAPSDRTDTHGQVSYIDGELQNNGITITNDNITEYKFNFM